MTFSTRSLLSLTIVLSCLAQAVPALDGMVLLTDLNRRLYVKYLSTGTEVTIQDGNVLSGCFSPDGRKVAFVNRTRDEWGTIVELWTAGIDGAGRVKIMNDTDLRGMNQPDWCTDGYVYFTQGMPTVHRVPQIGGNSQVIYTAHKNTQTPIGGYLDDHIGDFQLSLDGTRGTGTVKRFTSGGAEAGFSQMAIRLDLQQQFAISSPCQGSISPDGERLSVSAEGHRIYRIHSWDMPFVDYGAAGNTYSGCLQEQFYSTKKCPEELDAMLFGYELRDMLGLGSGWDGTEEIGNPRWSNTDGDIYLFNGMLKNTGAWAYRISTRHYTNLAPHGNIPWDYYTDELSPTTPFTLTPRSVTFDYAPGDVLPAARRVILTSAADMSSPQIRTKPVWLNIIISRVSGTEFVLDNTLVAGQLPAEGTHTAQVAVVPGGSSEEIVYDVSLHVGAPAQGLIVLHSPTGAELYAVGDTLRVRYSSDSILVPGTVVSLSIDGGEEYFMLNTGSSMPSGTNIVLDWVIPAQVLVGGLLQSPASNLCIVRVSKYPTGEETYSGLFTISEQTNAGSPRRRSLLHAARVSYIRHGSGATLSLPATQSGDLRIFDVTGRDVFACALVPGNNKIAIPLLKPGRYLLHVRPASGQFEAQAILFTH